jgi:hypothetical protein
VNWDGDVRKFGAKGDGVTDDSARIQAAINTAANGSEIRLPGQGPYNVARIEIRKPLTFKGDGIGTVVRLWDTQTGAGHATNNYILKVDVRDDWESIKNNTYNTQDGDVSPGGWLFGVTIEGLTFDGFGRTNAGAGLYVTRTERSEFLNLKFRALNGPAILVGNSTRESTFHGIKTEDCGAFDTDTPYAALHFLPRDPLVVNHEASNLLSFNQCEFIFSFWHNVYIESQVSPSASFHTVRQLQFTACNFHNWIFLPSWGDHTQSSSIYNFIMAPKYGWSEDYYDNWATNYSGINLHATGLVSKVIIDSCNFIAGSKDSGHIYATDGRSWQISNNRFEGKADGVGSSTWGALQLFGASATYLLSNNSFDIPTAPGVSKPWINDSSGGRVVQIGSQIFDSQVSSINSSNESSVDLKYDFTERRFRQQIGSTYNAENWVMTYGNTEPTSKRTMEIWRRAASLGTGKDGIFKRLQGAWRMESNSDQWFPKSWVNFDGGTSAYSFSPMVPAWAVGTDDFVILFETRVPQSVPPGTEGIVSLSSAYPSTVANNALNVAWLSSGSLLVSLRGNTGASDFRNAQSTDNLVSLYGGEWMRFALRRSSGAITLHANGRQLNLNADSTGGTAPEDWSATITSTYVVLGVRNGTGETLSGDIGDVAIIAETMSAEQANLTSLIGMTSEQVASSVIRLNPSGNRGLMIRSDSLGRSAILRSGVSIVNPARAGTVYWVNNTSGDNQVFAGVCVNPEDWISRWIIDSPGAATVDLGTTEGGADLANDIVLSAGKNLISLLSNQSSTGELWMKGESGAINVTNFITVEHP